MDKTTGAWSGPFSEPVDELVKRYTASIPVGYRLAEFDIKGSLAHARMLAHVGVLSADDLAAIGRGMAEILEEIRAGRFEWSLDLIRVGELVMAATYSDFLPSSFLHFLDQLFAVHGVYHTHHNKNINSPARERLRCRLLVSEANSTDCFLFSS